ncbi:hypothetical protein FACS1894176_04190 [Bacteroidia bacterium]|nr:hypothetical protein FACS1894176_04190 [Bacteroidia bacterium]
MQISYGTGPTRKKIIKYLDRENIENKISYKVDIKEDAYLRYYSQGIYYDSLLYANHYETIEEIHSNEEFDKLPGEVIVHENSEAYTNTMSYDGKEPHINEIRYHYYDNGNECWEEPVTDGGGGSAPYKKGLGGPYYYDNEYFMGMGISECSLVYYKKDGVEWGTPLTITGIDEITTKTSSVVYDKSNETFVIDIDPINLSGVFELIDTSGKIIK